MFRSNLAELEYYSLITALEREKGRCYVRLEQSEFYAEAGGQPSDKGTIGSCPVLSVMEADGETWHEIEPACSKELFVGMRVKAEVDRSHRLEMSRQHTGQHLFSAFLYRDFGIRTVGFHIGPETATIDTDRPAAEDILEKAEQKVLDAISSDIPVSVFVESAEQIRRLGLRKETDLEGDVQIIRIGDLDLCACCGTHVGSTKELLFFLVRKIEKHKDGCRIYFQFGQRALDFAREAVRIVQDVKEELEIHESEIPFRVRLLSEQTREDARTISELRTKLVRQMMLLPEYRAPLIYRELDEEEELIRSLAAELGRQRQNAILLDLRGLRIYGSLFQNDLPAGKFFRQHKTPGVRGGGGPVFFQGTADSAEELVEFGQKLHTALKERRLTHDIS